jgi:quercetin dioxygenase-like cupin family protein
MKRSLAILAAACLVLAVGARAADDKPKEKAKPAAKHSAAKAVLWSADELKWIDAPNSPPGVKMAVLWGDPAKGAHGAYMKLPAGIEAPLHHHTADHRVGVMSGKITLTPEGEAAKTLGPGSYFSFTGKKRHTTKCDAGADCILFMTTAGPWDVVLEEKK